MPVLIASLLIVTIGVAVARMLASGFPPLPLATGDWRPSRLDLAIAGTLGALGLTLLIASRSIGRPR